MITSNGIHIYLNVSLVLHTVYIHLWNIYVPDFFCCQIFTQSEILLTAPLNETDSPHWEQERHRFLTSWGETTVVRRILRLLDRAGTPVTGLQGLAGTRCGLTQSVPPPELPTAPPQKLLFIKMFTLQGKWIIPTAGNKKASNCQCSFKSYFSLLLKQSQTRTQHNCASSVYFCWARSRQRDPDILLQASRRSGVWPRGLSCSSQEVQLSRQDLTRCVLGQG